MSVGLVLEGGGQRGAYTAGVLQGLWSEGVRLDYVVGVSAGALTGINYVSGQLRRNYNTFVKYAPDPRYMGVRHIREHGGIFNFDFLLGNIVYDLLPFDFETFFGSSCRMRIGATDCRTGEAVYYDKEALRGDPRLTVLRATASLPLVSKMIRFDGRELLDGGIADPIPLQRSIDDGNDFNIIEGLVGVGMSMRDTAGTDDTNTKFSHDKNSFQVVVRKRQRNKSDAASEISLYMDR